MRKSSFFLFVMVILGVIASLSGCYKEPIFDVTPNISFKEVRKEIVISQFNGTKTDSLIISIGFQDGDGDLGYNNTEKQKAVVDVNNPNFNYVVKVFEQRKGKFTEKIFDYVPTSGFFDRLKTGDKASPIEGTLDYSISFPQSFTPRKDTLKFQIYLKDRAGHSSNTIETTPIVLNEF
jgi:hypothetical protein